MLEADIGLDQRARQAIMGAFLGFFVDMFDVWLPVIVLGPAISYFVPSILDLRHYLSSIALCSL